MSAKIHSLEALGALSGRLRARGRTVVQCHGTFDLLHPGHIRYFEEAKALGDALLVTVTADQFVRKGLGRPVFREELRAQSIAALVCVDAVAIDVHETAQEAIRTIRPDIFVKGSDYEGKECEEGHPTAREKELVERCGGRMHFTHDPVTFSSTALLNEHFSPLPAPVQAFLHTVCAQYSVEDIAAILAEVRRVRVLVVGDAILDTYNYSHFLGRSVKEEIPRVKVVGSETFLGGSLAVANTLAGFCDVVGVASVLGRQDLPREKRQEAFIRRRLQENVRPHFFYRADAPTIVNERFVNSEPYLVEKTTKVHMRKYFGLYHINEHPVTGETEAQWARALADIASAYDVIVVTDYGLGMLTEQLIATIVRLPAFLAVNTQTNSMNYGFNLITKYPRADYVSISLPEARLALHDKQSGIEDLAAHIARATRGKTVAITLGPLGVFLRARSSGLSIPALSTSVVDNIGAGDAFLALSSLCVFRRLPMVLTGFLGATASALCCGIIANKTTVDFSLFMETVRSLLKTGPASSPPVTFPHGARRGGTAQRLCRSSV